MLNIINRRANRRFLRWKFQSESSEGIRILVLQTALIVEAHKAIEIFLKQQKKIVFRNFLIGLKEDIGIDF